MRARGFFFLLAACALSAPVAAQHVYESQLSRNMLSMKDGDRAIITPNSQSVANSTTLSPEVHFTPGPDGFDLAITYRNSGKAAAPLGDICIPGLRLGASATSRDFRTDARLVPAGSVPALAYPSALYSPVIVVGDESVTFGISLLYPVLEYRHEVQVHLAPATGPYAAAGPNWEVHFRLQDELPPGQVRRYDVAVRATPKTSDWVRTLVPYRAYFQSLYMGVQYTRDPRPVSAMSVSSAECQAPQNAMGFCGPYASRPDTAGWVLTARSFRERPAAGYHRMMLWNPTGLFREHPDLNPPFRFMTHMNEVPPMRSTLPSLQGLAGPELDTGYWWGNSTLVMDGWDNGSQENFDPHKAAHAAKAAAEFDMATNLGATMIGMGQFTHTPVWDECEWLDTLRKRTPNVKFIISRDVACPDILHAMGPVWVNARDITCEKTLADLLLPGHETWCGLARADWEALALRKGSALINSDRDQEIQRIAGLGYIPVIFDDYRIVGKEYAAAESWLRTIPNDLVAGDTPPAEALLPAPLPPPSPVPKEAPHEQPAEEAAPPVQAPPITQAPPPPALRFSPRTYQGNQVRAAIERMRVSAFAKPRHRQVATEAPDDKPK